MKRQIALILALILAISLCACSSSKTAEPAAAEATTQSAAPAEAEVTQADIEENIVGKWIMKERDGQPVPTSEKVVYTFEAPDKAYVSASLNSNEKAGTIWAERLDADVIISDNNMTITYSAGDHTTSVHKYSISDITDNEFTANRKVTVTKDGNELLSFQDDCRYVKVNDDYSKEDIVGIWEGRYTSEGSVIDDGQDHRGEFKDDGTYVYYVKDGDNWVPNEDTMNEYFVAGNLLCLRWVENDTENREWWEITIDGDTMNMTALCEGKDGKTFTATFEMTKVEN